MYIIYTLYIHVKSCVAKRFKCHLLVNKVTSKLSWSKVKPALFSSWRFTWMCRMAPHTNCSKGTCKGRITSWAHFSCRTPVPRFSFISIHGRRRSPNIKQDKPYVGGSERNNSVTSVTAHANEHLDSLVDPFSIYLGRC